MFLLDLRLGLSEDTSFIHLRMVNTPTGQLKAVFDFPNVCKGHTIFNVVCTVASLETKGSFFQRNSVNKQENGIFDSHNKRQLLSSMDGHPIIQVTPKVTQWSMSGTCKGPHQYLDMPVPAAKRVNCLQSNISRKAYGVIYHQLLLPSLNKPMQV